ncbi:Hypothetical protein A7982_02314 [Minicystis rosea]|nr:Hypothetical protein A7982_02314 [Minicystis rosea]
MARTRASAARTSIVRTTSPASFAAGSIARPPRRALEPAAKRFDTHRWASMRSMHRMV